MQQVDKLFQGFNWCLPEPKDLVNLGDRRGYAEADTHTEGGCWGTSRIHTETNTCTHRALTQRNQSSSAQDLLPLPPSQVDQ